MPVQDVDWIGPDGQGFENIGLGPDGATTAKAAIVVGRELVFITGAFARPADTTAYSANDTVAQATGTASAPLWTLSGLSGGQSNNSGYIVKAVLETNQAANVARFRLNLFISPPAQQGDNAPYTQLYADAQKHVEFIDFPAMTTEGSGSTGARAVVVIGSGNLPLAFNTPGDADLWGILETLDAFTPANGQLFFLSLVAEVS